MFRHALLVAILGLAAVAITVAAPIHDGGTKPESGDPDFTGKVLVIWAKEPVKGGVIKNARVRKIGTRVFLVGESTKQFDGQELPESVYWYPVDGLQLINEYKNLEDARKMYALQAKETK